MDLVVEMYLTYPLKMFVLRTETCRSDIVLINMGISRFSM